ncbi:hypothetical protein K7H22_13670 [Seohaeicola saemankumensis]|uniref:hypothetical protein n=1 Tax=Seohaeicola saemankumensis TaxID=481181 RepID=UPI001E41241A|nr:hypothetical protein [Seohaeicola saemankumensis]MCD1627045.1 hypothetical protein [Seohaeicola saemankumensis]
MIVVTHNGTDITDKIDTESFAITDERNSTRDTLDFVIEKTPGGFAPELNAEIIVTKDGTRIFGGTILSFETSVEGASTVVYSVECVDFTRQLDRRLVTERFINQTGNEIIAFLRTNYASDFTITNVNAAFTVARISFNRLTVSQCLDKLAKLNNFNWYVDYNKDIHFFARNAEPAPFDISDTSDNFIFNSLKIRSDLSQLRNIIEVQGGEVPIAARSTLHAGDGETTEFPTNFKFAEKPTVTVDGVAQTVGTEYLDTGSFDCYWSFNEKYVRFDDLAIPAAPASGTTNIVLTGQPLVPLIAVVPDEGSIAEFGEFEFSVTENTLRSQDQTIARGLAELEAYAEKINEASFKTYTPGLRSGQLITISSTLHGVTAEYVIQSVNFRPYPNGSELDGIWSVTLASTATMSLVDALRKLLAVEKLEDDELKVLLAFFRFSDRASVTDDVDTPETTTPPYVWGTADWGFARWQ